MFTAETKMITWFTFSDSNKIKFMTSDVFSSLTKLKKIWLNFNKCINVNLEGETKIASLPGLIAAKCENSTDNFNESQPNCSAVSLKLSKLEAEFKVINDKNTELEAEKLKCQQQVKHIWELQQLWEKRWDATFAFKTGELKDELKKNKIEIRNKDLEIKKLEKQIEILSRNQTTNSTLKPNKEE